MMMNSHCITRCISDVHNPVIIRPTYRNLYKWPESDAEFVRSVSLNRHINSTNSQSHYPPTRVEESISCRQTYLRSYTFSRRKETVQEKIARKFFGEVKAPASKSAGMERSKGGGVFMKVKDTSCSAFLGVIRRMLACSTGAADVVHDA